jgi:hypothetical protein
MFFASRASTARRASATAMRFTAPVSCAAVRGRMRRLVYCAGRMSRVVVRCHCMAPARTRRCCVDLASAALTPMRCIGAIGCSATAAVIASAALAHKTMRAPAVAITPASPGTHPQKHAAVKVARSIEANRRAGVRRIVVVTV